MQQCASPRWLSISARHSLHITSAVHGTAALQIVTRRSSSSAQQQRTAAAAAAPPKLPLLSSSSAGSQCSSALTRRLCPAQHLQQWHVVQRVGGTERCCPPVAQ